jgi:4-amino-4-deoxy-L-arabinose transferase-like glycosyltransferase
MAAGALLWLAGLAAHPLLESTEGRYASIAAAMARSGNFLDPRFNGILHLEKPPLAYWAAAVALRVLPDSEFAVRLPATLAWILAAWLVRRCAGAAGLDARRAWWAAAFAALSPLAASEGHLLGCDVFLWTGVLLYQLAVLRWIASDTAGDVRAAAEARTSAAWLAGAGLGLGFMAKGHIVLVWTILPSLVAAAVGRRRVLLGCLGNLRTWALFLLLGWPWYVVEIVRHPGLLGYWLGHQTTARYLTTVHGRAEPWWYFPVLLPAIVLPWLPECVRGLRRAVRRARAGASASTGTASTALGLDPAVLFALACACVPFLFLCFSGSKRVNYLLPMLGPLAWLAAAALPARCSTLARTWSAAWVIVLLALPFVLQRVPRAVPPTRDIVQSARRAGTSLVAFRVLPSSAPFYWGEDIPVVEVPRDGRFDTPATMEKWAPQTPGALGARLARGGLVLCRGRDTNEARAAAGVPLQSMAAAGELVLLGSRIAAP